uniref:Uncharacterized protein n=1 Tax=Cacopsylla melanoneura TaxID=428564 RepID=A0A8D8T7B8_9HEMI
MASFILAALLLGNVCICICTLEAQDVKTDQEKSQNLITDQEVKTEKVKTQGVKARAADTQTNPSANIELSSARNPLPSSTSRLDLLYERRSKYKNVIVYGYPEQSIENIMRTVDQIGRKLGIDRPLSFVKHAFRINNNREKNTSRSIIIILTSHHARVKWLTSYRKRKLWSEKWYLNEQLTKGALALAIETKKWATERNFKNVWTWNDRIWLRRNESGVRELVIDLDHLSKLKTKT